MATYNTAAKENPFIQALQDAFMISYPADSAQYAEFHDELLTAFKPTESTLHKLQAELKLLEESCFYLVDNNLYQVNTLTNRKSLYARTCSERRAVSEMFSGNAFSFSGILLDYYRAVRGVKVGNELKVSPKKMMAIAPELLAMTVVLSRVPELSKNGEKYPHVCQMLDSLALVTFPDRLVYMTSQKIVQLVTGVINVVNVDDSKNSSIFETQIRNLLKSGTFGKTLDSGVSMGNGNNVPGNTGVVAGTELVVVPEGFVAPTAKNSENASSAVAAFRQLLTVHKVTPSEAKEMINLLLEAHMS